MDSLKEEVATLKLRVKELWNANCVQFSEYDEGISSKEDEINHLKGHLVGCTCGFTESEPMGSLRVSWVCR